MVRRGNRGQKVTLSARMVMGRLLGLGVMMLALLAAIPAPGLAQDFSFATVRDQAQRLAAEPYRKPEAIAASPLKAMSYEQYMQVRFQPNNALWYGTGASFRAEFFPAGFIFDTPVSVFTVVNGRATPVMGSATMFDFSSADLPAGTVPLLAGFRLTYPLHGAKHDEVIAFLGASYFRPIARGQVYGASARGLAIDTGLPRPEEFPYFRSFWLPTPVDAGGEAVVWALLDTPAAAGAYAFTIRPGTRTVVEVSASLFMRHDVSLMGLAPLTSMYLMGKGGPRRDDFRPEVHDSDGLFLHTGAGERIWRPLTNPKTLSVSSFVDRDPRGFGLLQREREFSEYQDTNANYHMRPGLWVEPLDPWGEGEIRLLELPTDSEVHDNIAAFWAPRIPPKKGERLDLRYRLTALSADPLPETVGRVVATRTSALGGRPRQRLVVVEFAGGDLQSLANEQPVEAVVSTSSGKILRQRAERSPTGTWRLFTEIEPDGRKPVDLRAFLRLRGEALTETWSYLLRP
ncbi:glucan biosynthesis protein G [soil metagenome]